VDSTGGRVSMLVITAMACCVAIAAALIGSRKRKTQVRSHALQGIIKKRCDTFQSMANRHNCAARPEQTATNSDDSGSDYNQLA